MKTYWDIDIDNKIASFKDEQIIYRFKFEVELDGALIVNKVEVLEDNQKIDISKMHTYMRNLGDELSLLYFNDKFQFSGETDWDDIPMYKIEDNIYIDDEATIVILGKMGFEDTDYMCDIDIENIENTPINLAKLLVCYDDEEYKYITFSELKEQIC